MNMYRILGDRIGTIEARELAQQLVAWHDAMVKHLRVVGSRPIVHCADGCPHEDASALWTAARSIFGEDAGQLAFLRSHGQRQRASSRGVVQDRAAEMSA